MFINNSREEAESKLILLYILQKFEIPVTNTQITELIMENDLLNYFMLQQFLSELVESSLIEYSKGEDENYYYIITEKGKNTLNFFKGRLIDEIIEKIDNAVEMKKKRILKETEVSATYKKISENSYIAELKVVEKDYELINIKINVVSNKQAKIICDNWKNKAPYIYGKLMDLLIE